MYYKLFYKNGYEFLQKKHVQELNEKRFFQQVVITLWFLINLFPLNCSLSDSDRSRKLTVDLDGISFWARIIDFS